MSTIISASIDLAKIDKKNIYEKDGKKYLSLQISVNDETKYGNNVSVAIGQTKEQREAKVDKTYLGNGKVVWTDGKITLADKQDQPQMKSSQKDDLPF
jgi:hypothetical protein